MKLLSAVFTKEMTTLSRHRRYFLVRATLLGALLMLISAKWFLYWDAVRYDLFADLSSISSQLFTDFINWQWVGILVIMPALVTPLVSREKEKGTLSILMMSNLTAYNILLDKLFSRMLLVGILVLSGLPLLLSLLAFGGVEPGQIVNSYVSLLGMMLLCCAVGLFFSTIANRTYSAMMLTYLFVAGYFVILWEMSSISKGYDDILSPAFPSTAKDSGALTSLAFLVFNVGLFIISVICCAHMLNRFVVRPKRGSAKAFFHRLNAFFHKINFSGIVLYNESRTPGRNPVLWKETHTRVFASTTFNVRLFVLLSAVVMILFVVESGLLFFTFIGSLVLAAVVTALGSATAFTTEREKQCFNILMSSPLRSREIVVAKVSEAPKPALPFVGCALLSWIGFNNGVIFNQRESILWDLLYIAFLVFCFLPLIAVIGLGFSIARRRTGPAVLQTFVTCFAVQLVPNILDTLLLGGNSYWCTDNGFFAIFAPVTAFRFLNCTVSPFIYCYFHIVFIVVWLLRLRRLISKFDAFVGRL